jgi:hypothetical protein
MLMGKVEVPPFATPITSVFVSGSTKMGVSTPESLLVSGAKIGLEVIIAGTLRLEKPDGSLIQAAPRQAADTFERVSR